MRVRVQVSGSESVCGEPRRHYVDLIMAALASSAVSLYPGDLSSSEWPSGGKGIRSRYTRNCKVVLTTQGTAANPIPASAFGLSKLIWCSMLYDRTNGKAIPAVVDPTTNTIL